MRWIVDPLVVVTMLSASLVVLVVLCFMTLATHPAALP